MARVQAEGVVVTPPVSGHRLAGLDRETTATVAVTQAGTVGCRRERQVGEMQNAVGEFYLTMLSTDPCTTLVAVMWYMYYRVFQK